MILSWLQFLIPTISWKRNSSFFYFVDFGELCLLKRPCCYRVDSGNNTNTPHIVIYRNRPINSNIHFRLDLVLRWLEGRRPFLPPYLKVSRTSGILFGVGKSNTTSKLSTTTPSWHLKSHSTESIWKRQYLSQRRQHLPGGPLGSLFNIFQNPCLCMTRHFISKPTPCPTTFNSWDSLLQSFGSWVLILKQISYIFFASCYWGSRRC